MGQQVSLIQFNGKVGNVVGSKGADGKMLLRSRPVLTKKTNTESQILQRTLFAAVSTAASTIPDAFFDSLVVEAKKLNITPRNLFVKNNVRASNSLPTSSKPWAKGHFDTVFSPQEINIIFNDKGFETPIISRPYADNPGSFDFRIQSSSGLEVGDVIQLLLKGRTSQTLTMETIVYNNQTDISVPVSQKAIDESDRVFVFMQVARTNDEESRNAVVSYYTSFWSAWSNIRGSLAERISWSKTKCLGSEVPF